MGTSTAELAVICFALGSVAFFLMCIVRAKWEAGRQRNLMVRQEERQELCMRDTRFISLHEQSPRNTRQSTRGEDDEMEEGRPVLLAKMADSLAVRREDEADQTVRTVPVDDEVRPVPVPRLAPTSPLSDSSINFRPDDSQTTRRPSRGLPEDSINILQESVALTIENTVLEDEAATRDVLSKEYSRIAEKISLAAQRWSMPFGSLGSIGVTLTSADCAEVHEVIRPGEGDELQVGDVIIGVETPVGQYNVVGKRQLCKALGPLGGAFCGTEVTLKVIRDEEHKQRWREAAAKLDDTEVGGTRPPGVFVPDSDITYVKTELADVGRELNSDFLIAQADQEKCRCVVWDLFQEFANERQEIARDDFYRMQRHLEEVLGLPHVLTEELDAHFDEADIFGTSALGFTELYPLMRWLIFDALSCIVYSDAEAQSPKY